MTHPGRTIVVAIALLGLGATACSSSSAPSATSSPPSSGVVSNNDQGGSGAAFRGPAAFGLIAAVDAADIQVQDPSTGQTEVTFTAKTRFIETKATTRSALSVGSCVLAITSSATSTDATSVTISAAVSGRCSGGFGGFGRGGQGFPAGNRPSGAPSGFPRSVPSNIPSGARAAFGSAVFGQVTAISGNTITVAARDRTTSSTAGTSSAPTTTPKTLTLTSATKYEATGPATKAALKVGKCAIAQGTTDSTGAVAATSISLSPAVSGQCSTRFGRRTFGGGGNG